MLTLSIVNFHPISIRKNIGKLPTTHVWPTMLVDFSIFPKSLPMLFTKLLLNLRYTSCKSFLPRQGHQHSWICPHKHNSRTQKEWKIVWLNDIVNLKYGVASRWLLGPRHKLCDSIICEACPDPWKDCALWCLLVLLLCRHFTINKND